MKILISLILISITITSKIENSEFNFLEENFQYKFGSLKISNLTYPYTLKETNSTSYEQNVLSDKQFVDVKADDIFNVKCFWISGFNLFDISNLQRPDDQKTDLQFENGMGDKVYYNFCGETIENCGTSTVMAGKQKEDPKECKTFAGGADKFNHFSLLDKTNASLGVMVKLSAGEKCPTSKTGEQYQVVFNITCNPFGDKGKLVLHPEDMMMFDFTKCSNTLRGASREGCPQLNYYIISYFMNEYNIFIGIFAILVGFFLVAYGGKFLKVTVFVIVTLSCVTLSLMFIFGIWQFEKASSVWIVIGVSAFIGLFLSWFLIKSISAFFMILGAYLGYMLGLFAYNIGLNRITIGSPTLVYWITIAACIITGALIALCLVKHILIIGTSITGAYLVIRGISLYAGHFPNESVIIDLAKKSEWGQFDEVLL